MADQAMLKKQTKIKQLKSSVPDKMSSFLCQLAMENLIYMPFYHWYTVDLEVWFTVSFSCAELSCDQ